MIFFNNNNKNAKMNHAKTIISDFVNNLDLFPKSIEDVIERLDKKREKLNVKMDKLEEGLTYVVDKDGRPCDSDLYNYNQIFDLHFEEQMCELQIKSLYEMIILNLHKSIELTINELLHMFFEKTESKHDFHKTSHLVDFLENKGIEFGKIIKNNIFIEIKSVNNCIKHSDDIKDLKKIKEFKGKNSITPELLRFFYARTKPFISTFINSLNDFICDSLYNFNGTKIKKIAEDFNNRMDEKHANMLIEELKNSYKRKRQRERLPF
jgi:hypothetical protein